MIWVDGCGRARVGMGGGGGGGVGHGTGGRGCVDARVRERSPSRAFAFASAWRAAVRHGAPRPAAVAQAVRASAPHPGRQSALDFLVVAFCGRAVHRRRAALARRTYAARRGDGPQVSVAGGVGVGTGGLVPRGALLLDEALHRRPPRLRPRRPPVGEPLHPGCAPARAPVSAVLVPPPRRRGACDARITFSLTSTEVVGAGTGPDGSAAGVAAAPADGGRGAVPFVAAGGSGGVAGRLEGAMSARSRCSPAVPGV